ncbi:hypothetical protein OIU77_000177 [Salix suchowensis]|uniref:Patatin n=1 Tax=Salix suchowensis TaxID=1278906 RepID=A0ABQ9B717_9ROSI|nr:hypothetical protein OIU77_000177 [Salix suchowensis]
MAAVHASTMPDDSSFAVDKLTYEIFSILENKFLFGGYDDPKLSKNTHQVPIQEQLKPTKQFNGGKGNPDASVSDYFDVVAGSGSGGVLAALLFTRGKNGRPMFTAEEALNFLVKINKKMNRSQGVLGKLFGSAKAEKVFAKTFGELTLKDTIKSALIPCYDLSSNAPFLFSRADALEMDGYDFKMSDVCLATSADPTKVGACGHAVRRQED